MNDIYYDNDLDLYGGKIKVKYLKSLLKQSYKNKSLNVDNYILDNELSTDKTKVYFNKDTNEISMVSRGTSDIHDIFTDVKMFFGYKDNRFKESKNILNKIKEKYPNSSIDILGHSLAGAIAETIGNDPQVKNIITLNKPTTPLDLINKSKINDKQYDIRTSNDIISILTPLQTDKNDITIPSKSNNPFTEHKIETLDRLPPDLIIGSGKTRLKKETIKKIVNEYLKSYKDINKNDKKILKLYLKNML